MSSSLLGKFQDSSAKDSCLGVFGCVLGLIFGVAAGQTTSQSESRNEVAGAFL